MLSLLAAAAISLLPQPTSIRAIPCAAPLRLDRALRFAAPAPEDGGFALLSRRWAALGITPPATVRPDASRDVYQRAERPGAPSSEAYGLRIDGRSVLIDGRGAGVFNALMTLAQLPRQRDGHWELPCVEITDAPAMRWRIVSDDVSRGPFPTMAYAKERIRTLASLKVNGWSPYMEQVFSDPRSPYVAWPNGWNAQQLRELAAYARRFHVTLIPEQQTFAHMHESLKWESRAPLAELPHGYLLAASDPGTYAYLEPLIRAELAATAPVPFMALGADEPLDLGRGRTPRTPQVFAEHVRRVAAMLGGRARPMIWDDAIQQDRTILGLIPRNTVILSFHYGVEASYRRYIDAVSTAGFDQMVSPGAANWNEVYPDLATAYTNVGRFVGEAKNTKGMLGTFMTVWHDDGESLYEATWPAVAYAAASAWQQTPVDDAAWHATFARAFFGSDDPRYARALDALRDVRGLLRTTPSDPPDYVFWHDPFDPRLQARVRDLDLATVRTRAEAAAAGLWNAAPPLHAQAAEVMRFGALRYDQLARRLQIGREARTYYDDARSQAVKPEVSGVYRSLNVAKYFCWELRDGIAALQPLYERAWRYESTEPGLARVLVRYRLAESEAQRYADRIDAVTREDYLRRQTVPAWEEGVASAR